MTGSTKILTVSYGTFSCTLEGFDDPMGTMRDIAEYFRDLAADDRYFGAEPPTPDVEMLQNIAQREAGRRVDAQIADRSVKLQVAAETAEAEVVEPEAKVDESFDRVAERLADEKPKVKVEEPDQAVSTESETGPLAFDDEYLLADEPADVLAVDPEADIQIDEGPAESVAEKLRRIRAVVSRGVELEEPKERSSFSDAPARDAIERDAAPKRDRANTEILNQITAELAEPDTENDQQVEAPVASDQAPAASEIAESIEEPSAVPVVEQHADERESFEDDFEPEAEMAPEPQVQEAVANASETEEAEEDEFIEPRSLDRDDSNVLGNVLGRTSSSGVSEQVEEQFEAPAAEREPSKRPASRERSRPTTRPLSSAEESQSMDRLLAEADTKLNEDDVLRRQRVISQMRAAVVATKAERILTKNPVSKEEELAREEKPYRADLDAVVKSNPNAEGAPLVLVSSQRIDSQPSETRGHVHTDADQSSEAKEEEFKAFASAVGAKELPELLEAAAAYSAFVKGQASFTRPEIIRRVARYDPSLQLTREEGLRSFGQLLRQGTFEKLERGQFSISGDSRYRPEQQIAGE